METPASDVTITGVPIVAEEVTDGGDEGVSIDGGENGNDGNAHGNDGANDGANDGVHC